VLLAVTGSSGLSDVIGLQTTEPTALLNAVGDPGDQSVVTLCPTHDLPVVRSQAHVLVSAHPRSRVAVLGFHHHPLTLTLVAAAVRAQHPADDDPGRVSAALRRAAARSRSLVWYPRVVRLGSPQPSIGQGIHGLVRSSGYLLELGPQAALTAGRRSAPLDLGRQVFSAEEPPELLTGQVSPVPTVVPVDLVPGQPWWAPGCVPLGVPVTTSAGPTGATCRICGAERELGGCVFCGTGPDRLELVALSQASPVTGTDQLVTEGNQG
jgi:hypothetical protein